MMHTSIQQEPQQKQMPADGIILNKTNSGHLQYVKVQLQKQSVDLCICFLMKPWVFDS